VPATRSATALTSTDKGVRPPNARLTMLGPILMPLVMPADAGGGEIADSKTHEEPIAVAARLAGAVTSLAHNSASIEAIMASASAPPRIVGKRAMRSLSRARPPK